MFKHIGAVGIEGPKGALSRRPFLPGHLDETFVEAEVVPDGVLPALAVVPVVREALHDEVVNAVEGDFALVGRVDGHGDEGDVRVGWFLVVLRVVEEQPRGQQVSLQGEACCSVGQVRRQRQHLGNWSGSPPLLGIFDIPPPAAHSLKCCCLALALGQV